MYSYLLLCTQSKVMSSIAKTSTRKNKHFILDQSRLKRAQKALGTRTETETIEIALENVITEAERDRIASTAHEEFVRGMVEKKLQILDVFGRLENK